MDTNNNKLFLLGFACGLVICLGKVVQVEKNNKALLLALEQANAKKQQPVIGEARMGVGIGVLVFDNSKQNLVIGLRKAKDGNNTWALPGGWMEKNETFEACGLREIQEEINILGKDVESVEFASDIPATNNLFSVSLFVRVVLKTSVTNITRMEPDKCLEWKFVNIKNKSDWPSPLFPSLEYLVKNNHI